MKQSLFCKTISVLLTISSLLSSVSCGKKSSEKSKKISSEDPWYDATVYSIDPELDVGEKEIDYKTQKLAGSDENYIVEFLHGNYVIPDYSADYDSSDYEYYLAVVVDRNTGSKINTVNLNEYLSGDGYVMDVRYFDGKITSTIYRGFENGGGVIEIDTDVMTGDKLDEREVSNEGSGLCYRFQVEKYEIIAEIAYDPVSSYSYSILKINSSDGEEKQVILKKDRVDLNYIPIIFSLGNERIIVPVTQTSTNKPVFFEVDISESAVKEVDEKEYEWIDFKRITNGYGGKDGYGYYSTSVGISRIDIQGKKVEEIFNYNTCLLNHELLSNTEIVDCSENGIVLLSGRYMSFSLESSSEIGFDIYVISKSSVNPNAGKTVLELYATNGYVDHTIGEAITRFNKTNENYYIEVTGRYVLDEYQNFLPSDSSDDVAIVNLQANASLNDKLAMDIMNGVGPDILILYGDMGRLNNSVCLADLSNSFSSIDSGKYFANVIDAARSDGKLYQLPITFGIEGIHTASEYAGVSGTGFTTKEYEDFLYGTLNGDDLIQTGQAVYFTTLFNSMSDVFIKDGRVDFTGTEFSELADFVKENVKESALSYDSEEAFDNEGVQEDTKAQLAAYYGMINYFVGVKELKGSQAILGIPSTDGRGPMVRSSCSVAVSAQAVDINACTEFAKILISDEIQYELANKGFLTLSREAFRNAGSLTLDYCNGPRGNSEFGIDRDTNKVLSNRIRFTEVDITILENIILSCSHFDSADTSINIILIEEMPAYFLGQKDLDSVIKIVQDRVQKVLDERS